MKKQIMTFCLVIIFLACTLTSCQNNSILVAYQFETGPIKVDVKSGYDAYMCEERVGATKTIDVFGETVTLKYSQSQIYNLYGPAVHYYTASNIRYVVDDSDKVISVQNLNIPNTSKANTFITEENSISIAKEYLRDAFNFDLTEYEITLNMLNKSYVIKFEHFYNGLKVSDDIEVSMTLDGKIYDFSVNEMFYEMKDIERISKSEIESVEKKLNEKLNSLANVYQVKHDYEFVTYQVSEKNLVKLSSGEYAIEYRVDFIRVDGWSEYKDYLYCLVLAI